VPIDPRQDLAVLQYTGGTTGVAKGVMLGHDNMGANVQQCSAVLHAIGDEPEVFLGLLPYFHVYGLTVCINFATALGATVAPYPQFVPQEVLKAMEKVRPTIFPSAPAVFNALLQQKNIRDFDLRSIRFCVTGSAPMPVELTKQFKELTGAEIIEGFGLTETSPVTHLNPIRGKRKAGSIGLPFPDTDASIVDTEMGTKHLPPGEEGELIIKGPQVMRGYWGRPEETAGTLRNNWLFTGDIASMDEEGYFFIVDRKKDLIISGGYNIYPREIDEVLYEHPQVADAVCVGVPHKTRGEIIKAYIVPKPDQEIEKKEIVAFCRQKLANYKVPKQIEFRKELPKTIVGKVLRRVLREEEEQKKRKADKAGE
jgi:long-chain acyl-CoA synthetase